jgi:uncharacterized protein YjdB
VKDLSLSETHITIEPGDTAYVKAIITPADAADQDVVWRYSTTNRNTKLIASGLEARLTSTREDTYTITATLGDFQAECVVTVTASSGVQDVTADTEDTRKLIRDGQLQIEHKGETYSVTGEKL